MVPSICVNGCGFYASSNNNLCSKCYNDYLKENIEKSNDHESCVIESTFSSSMNPNIDSICETAISPSICVNGCGFYASSNNNLCSKCYNDYLKENIEKSNDHESCVIESTFSSSINPNIDSICETAISLADNQNILVQMPT
ncbi:unnamed protein product [Lathyrus sativus]|nr:unnamed protein product [Lathyrus sativus]